MVCLGELILERRHINLKPLVLVPAGVKGEATYWTLGLPIEELRQFGIFIPSGEDIPAAQRTLWRQNFASRIDVFGGYMRAAGGIERDGQSRSP